MRSALIISGVLATTLVGCKTSPQANRGDVLSLDQPAYMAPAPIAAEPGYMNPAPEPMPAPSVDPVTPQPIGPMQHTIAKGDTLWSLSIKYYNDGKQYKKIVDANPGISETRLPVGKTIVIP